MSPTAIRTVDRYVGCALCAALTVVRWITRLFRWRRAHRPPQSILFIKLTEQGATVLAYRAIMRAIEMVGRENVYFMVFQENRPILDFMNLIPAQNVLPVRNRGALRLMIDLVRHLWRMRRLGIEATVDLEFFARASAIIAYLTGARVRVGLHRFTSEGPFRGDLLTHRVQYNPYIHTAAGYYLLVESAACEPVSPLPKVPVPKLDWVPAEFEPSPQEVDALRQKLDELGATGQRLVILNPNASDMLPLRKWPTERFEKLGRLLLTTDPNLIVLISGAPSEREAAEAIAQRIGPRAVSLAGHTSLRELLVLYCLADVLVTNDSGPGHFSSLTPIDAIVLFGPETPALFGPLGPRSHVLHAPIACSPCVNVYNHRHSPCKDSVCMRMITVEQVFDHVTAIFAERSMRTGRTPWRKRVQLAGQIGQQIGLSEFAPATLTASAASTAATSQSPG